MSTDIDPISIGGEWVTSMTPRHPSPIALPRIFLSALPGWPMSRRRCARLIQ
jgi:hypothetical protein